MTEFRLIVRFGEQKPDATVATADPTSFVRTLNTALAVEGYQPVALWVIEHKNRAVASRMAGHPVFIDAPMLERLGCAFDPSDVPSTAL